MDEAEQNRSEAPTAFKLQRARRKGSVARGADLGFLTSLVAFVGFAWASGPSLGRALGEAMREAMVGSAQIAAGPDAVTAATLLIAAPLWRPMTVMAGTIFAIVLLFEVVQTGIVFSSEPLKPDFSRLNPARGLKRIFTLRLLIETAKNVVKLAIYTAIGYFVIRGALRGETSHADDAIGLAALMTHETFRLLGGFALAALAFAIIDQLINRRDFLKRMRMSRRELRREARDREGEPRLKQRRKQMHAEFVRMSQSLRAIRTADVLIVNPRHIAVALRYDARNMGAPRVVSLGTDRFALRLKRLAFVYGIPVVENRPLAQMLVKTAAIGREVPEQTFQPVADIYNRLRPKQRG